MKRVLAIILGGGAGTRLYPLTKLRAKPAVPLGAQYRLIDIPISNCINSEIQRIYVLPQFNSASLNRHIARTYHLAGAGFTQGFVEVLAAQQTPGDPSWFEGTADAVRKYLWLFAEWDVDQYLILSGDHLYRMNYADFIERHRQRHDFGRGILPGSLSDHNVQAYLFNDYWEDIGTIEAFYNANLALTYQPDPPFSFYDEKAPIYTRSRYLPPTKLLDSKVI